MGKIQELCGWPSRLRHLFSQSEVQSTELLLDKQQKFYCHLVINFPVNQNIKIKDQDSRLIKG